MQNTLRQSGCVSARDEATLKSLLSIDKIDCAEYNHTTWYIMSGNGFALPAFLRAKARIDEKGEI